MYLSLSEEQNFRRQAVQDKEEIHSSCILASKALQGLGFPFPTAQSGFQAPCKLLTVNAAVCRELPFASNVWILYLLIKGSASPLCLPTSISRARFRLSTPPGTTTRDLYLLWDTSLLFLLTSASVSSAPWQQFAAC